MQKLKEYAGGYGIALDDRMLGSFGEYLGMLIEWNKKINLTAITEPEQVLVKHFLDSLLVLYAYDIPQGAKLIDVGAGAGFPGIPLKIARPDIELTLLDSTGKKLRFLEAVSDKLGQSNRTLHMRAEDAARTREYRESFDIAAARAVAALPALCEYCLPFVKRGGMFLALKGPDADRELEDSRNAVKILGGGESEIRRCGLPGGGDRRIVRIVKDRRTPAEYPRNQAKIAQSGL